MSKQAMETDWIDRVVQDVAELSDRNSPEDWPDAMLVTADELRQIIEHRAKEAIKQHDAEPVAWLVKSKRGMIRACWSEKPSEEQVAVAEADGDTIFPLYLSAPSIPEDFVLVPKEPTPAMILAFWEEEDDSCTGKWDALLAASPQPK